jgi:hypothetical protein
MSCSKEQANSRASTMDVTEEPRSNGPRPEMGVMVNRIVVRHHCGHPASRTARAQMTLAAKPRMVFVAGKLPCPSVLLN